MTSEDLHENRQAITDLFFAYAWHFDRSEPDLGAALFTDDATIDYGPAMPPLHGRAEIGSRVATGLSEIFEGTSRHISNVSTTFDGDETAAGVAYVYAWHRYLDGSPEGYLWDQ